VKSSRIGVHVANAVVWEPVYERGRAGSGLYGDRRERCGRADGAIRRHHAQESVFVVDVRGVPADVEDAREAVHGRGEQPVPSRRLEPHARDVLAVRVVYVGVAFKGVRSGVVRRRRRGLKPEAWRRDAPAKVLKDRRSHRERGRTGTGV
jgi:hypothetical protein